LIQPVDQADQAHAPIYVLFVLQADIAPTQTLHDLEYLGRCVLLEHETKQTTQQLDALS